MFPIKLQFCEPPPFSIYTFIQNITRNRKFVHHPLSITFPIDFQILCILHTYTRRSAVRDVFSKTSSSDTLFYHHRVYKVFNYFFPTLKTFKPIVVQSGQTFSIYEISFSRWYDWRVLEIVQIFPTISTTVSRCAIT